MNNYQKNILNDNIFYIEKLYQKFLLNPNSINKNWINIFKSFEKKNKILKKNNNYYKNLFLIEKINKLLINFRVLGHYYANTNPLSLNKKKLSNNLQLKYYQISQEDYQKKITLNNFLYNQKIIDLHKIFQKIYCKSIGIEYTYLPKNEKCWIQNNIEIIKNNFNFLEKKIFLEELIAAEVFETNIGKKFPGAKRFSLEGCDVLIPLVKEIIRYSNKLNNKPTKIIFSMAHRGRLNFLVNIMGKKIQDIINEFSNTILKKKNENDDVKYHLGYSSIVRIKKDKIKLELVFNPSHLEIINCVTMGMVRFENDFSKINHKYNNVLPISIHGDAAISGQGIVQEVLNLSKTRGYNINGVIHIIINNQIGFTTSNINDIRSSYYCTDIAKMIRCPVFHVNADKIEDVIFIIRIAINYRNIFHKDVFIDLVSYRRHGHNEMDDPYMTQPLMYNIIKNHLTIQDLYFNKLLFNKIINFKEKHNLYKKYQTLFNEGNFFTKTDIFYKKKYIKKIYKNLKIDKLKKLLFKISTFPKEFNIHPIVKKIYLDRISMSKEEKKIDWGTAENLAYANILVQGISCRLSGEDIKRGTFSHRHTVIYDQKNGFSYIPLKNIAINQGNFNIYNSVLSEESVLGFEYGYSINNLNIVIWEAQFGDFANGAQIIIDQFISSGEKKWGYKSSLILFLPHGYEGQGPEHSSSRIERYLQ
ncbi:2-oxoglutarate dehydrogenase E1 component, partial [Enterobacteriaceae endosymbiont of Donacia semicuprea]|uniref:2-oxoglutarate dehydrogenase E1 component n=1 Tax=Enterobacteriaceae endosymbiont of Donacia semicuprea TaxID=2675783 RepID=UPI0014567881